MGSRRFRGSTPNPMQPRDARCASKNAGPRASETRSSGEAAISRAVESCHEQRAASRDRPLRRVDSAVAAALLKDAGYDVHALFMRNWDEDEDGYCTAAADLQDARRVCADLGIPLHTVNFARDYRDRVFEHFLAELRAGRTPNPDVACNREIKFGVCFEHARRLGADWFATGHYARTASIDGKPRLLRAADVGKDQTYFLHTVPGELLARTLFPVAGFARPMCGASRSSARLPVHAKRDSTGICFIGERPFAEFLARYLPAQPGSIETTDGRVIGRASRLLYYTLGQRQGLAVGGVRARPRRRGTSPQRISAATFWWSRSARRSAVDVSRIRHRSGALDRWIAAWARFDCTVKTRYRNRPGLRRDRPPGRWLPGTN